MRTTRWSWLALALLGVAPAAWGASHDGALDVEIWTDRGNDAVYQPGDAMEVRVRSSEDGFLLVYEVDADGGVHLLWPDRGSRGFIEGRTTLRVPSERSNLELVVDDPTGQGYLVALVSREPFRDLPWYLRPYDMQAEGSGYVGEPDDEEGITRDGRVVGDPFVAMERVRRRVLTNPEDPDAFGTAYTSYYVHERVRYPRYLCYDCHRPGYWAWWDGFDPYYASCSVFTFRVNWGWYWGPTYWFGYVPYYYYVVRDNCPPRYRLYATHRVNYSSWSGWNRWRSLMGNNVRRYKSPPPPGYTPPSKFRDRAGRGETPPGILIGREVAPGRRPGGSLRPTSEDRRSGIREPADRIERPRDAVRGGQLGRPQDTIERPRRDDSETRGSLRGNPERAVERPVWRGRSERSQRPGDERPAVRGRSDYGERRSGERPSYRPRDEGSRGSSRPEVRREAPRQERREPQRVERRDPPKEEGNKGQSQPKQDRNESRGGDRGRSGRPGR